MNKSLLEACIYIESGYEDDAETVPRVIEIARCFLDSPAIKSLFVCEDRDRDIEFPEVREFIRGECRHRRVQGMICGSTFS